MLVGSKSGVHERVDPNSNGRRLEDEDEDEDSSARKALLGSMLLFTCAKQLGAYENVNSHPRTAQLSLFDQGAPLHRTMDDVRKRYGYDALRIALGDAGENERERAHDGLA